MRPVPLYRLCLAAAAVLGVVVSLPAESPQHGGMFRTGVPDEMYFYDPRCSNETKLSFCRIDGHVIVDGDLDLGTVEEVLKRSWKLALQTAKGAEEYGLGKLNLTDEQKDALKRLAKMAPGDLPTENREQAEKHIEFANEALRPLQQKRKSKVPEDREQAFVIFAGPSGEFLWKDGVVPYVIELDNAGRDRVCKAMQVWTDKTNKRVTFVARNEQRDSDYVCFVRGDGCWSQWVGKMGDKQTVTLDDRCGLPHVLHEIGHVLGLFHEHNRTDRNLNIEIDKKHIDDNALAQFTQNPLLASEDKGRPVGKFDWESIMLYPPNAFSKDGQPTLVRKGDNNNLDWGLEIGSGRGNGVTKEPSERDVGAIVQLYGKKK
jgi:hypothetical protein